MDEEESHFTHLIYSIIEINLQEVGEIKPHTPLIQDNNPLIIALFLLTILVAPSIQYPGPHNNIGWEYPVLSSRLSDRSSLFRYYNDIRIYCHYCLL